MVPLLLAFVTAGVSESVHHILPFLNQLRDRCGGQRGLLYKLVPGKAGVENTDTTRLTHMPHPVCLHVTAKRDSWQCSRQALQSSLDVAELQTLWVSPPHNVAPHQPAESTGSEQRENRALITGLENSLSSQRQGAVVKTSANHHVVLFAKYLLSSHSSLRRGHPLM